MYMLYVCICIYTYISGYICIYIGMHICMYMCTYVTRKGSGYHQRFSIILRKPPNGELPLKHHWGL